MLLRNVVLVPPNTAITFCCRPQPSPLFLAAEQSLTSRGGLIGFFHDYLPQAVRDRYLSSETDRSQAHLRLADYFGSRETAAIELICERLSILGEGHPCTWRTRPL